MIYQLIGPCSFFLPKFFFSSLPATRLNKLERLFVYGFQISLMFASKSRAYLSEAEYSPRLILKY